MRRTIRVALVQSLIGGLIVGSALAVAPTSQAVVVAKSVPITAKYASLSGPQVRRTFGHTQYVSSTERSRSKASKGYTALYELNYDTTRPQLFATAAERGTSDSKVKRDVMKRLKGMTMVSKKYNTKRKAGKVVQSMAKAERVKVNGKYIKYTMTTVVVSRFSRKTVVGALGIVVKYGSSKANVKTLTQKTDRASKVLAKRYKISTKV